MRSRGREIVSKERRTRGNLHPTTDDTEIETETHIGALDLAPKVQMKS